MSLAALFFAIFLTKTRSDGDCGNFTFSVVDENLTISGRGVLDYFECPGDPPVLPHISHLVIESGITEVMLERLQLRDLQSVFLPDSLVVIREHAFANCRELTSVEWGEGLREIRRAAFMFCDSLRIENLSHSLEIIEEEAFMRCEMTQLIVLGPNVRVLDGHWWPDSCEGIFVDSENPWFASLSNGGLFTKDLSTVRFWPDTSSDPTQVLPPETRSIGPSAFASGWNEFPEGFLSGIDTLEPYAFEDSSLRVFNASRIKVIPPYAFEWSTSLTTVIFSPELVEIGESAFHVCLSLILTSLPETLCVIGETGFRSCSRINITSLPNVLVLRRWTFQICYAITTLELGAVTSIGNNCFDGAGLTRIWLPDSLVTIAANSFTNTALVSICINGEIDGITASSFAGITGVPELHIRGPVGSTLCEVTTAVWPTNNNVFVSSWSGLADGEMICERYLVTVDGYTRPATVAATRTRPASSTPTGSAWATRTPPEPAANRPTITTVEPEPSAPFTESQQPYRRRRQIVLSFALVFFRLA
jgi:hypothetical protein